MDLTISDVQQATPETQKIVDLVGVMFNFDVLRKR